MTVKDKGLESYRQNRGQSKGNRDKAAQREHGSPCVMVADDHTIVLEGLRLSLEAAGINVVGAAHNAEQTLQMLQNEEIDVLLTDLHMPGMSGLQLLQLLRQEPRPFKVAILTGDGNSQLLAKAQHLNVDGFLSKDLSGESLAQAVRNIAAGEKVYLLSEEYVHVDPKNIDNSDQAQLTNQELEVLRMLAQAFDNSQIATALVISENTVKSHVSSILSKLGVANRTQAALWALAHKPRSNQEPDMSMNTEI